ncbi:MAG: stealth conserved region 3 domain-containing protein [Actinomycetes bacterium]
MRRSDELRKRALPLPTVLAQSLPVPGAVRRVTLARARRRLGEDAGLRVVRRWGESYLAAPLPGPRLTVVTHRNLEMVVDALETADVEYHVVQNESFSQTTVAVMEADRHRVLRVMASRWADQPVYVGLARRDCLSFEHAVLVRRGLEAPAAATAGVLRLFRAYSSGALTVADDRACDLEFWREDDGAKQLVAPRPNRVSTELPIDSRPTRVTIGDRSYRGIEPFSVVTPTEIDFPIDIVYTWVDGADPVWSARRDQYLGKADATALNAAAADAARYVSRDELRFSLRSVEMFAPWVRQVYLVTDGQVPPWLDTSSSRVRVVDHREIFTDPTVLPTFNSHAIESQLHHIDGLAEHYLYLNDDMLFGRPIVPTTFFHANGLAKMFLSPARVAFGEPSRRDLPVMAAAKNNRQLMLRDFGRYVTQKQKHAPYPHRRSVLYEMEDKYSEDFARTAASRFRHPRDISIAASLQQYYAFMTGRTVPGGIAYTYVDLADPAARTKLRNLAERRGFDAYCLNDTDSTTVDLEAQMGMVRSFFETFYPVPASWERVGTDERTSRP